MVFCEQDKTVLAAHALGALDDAEARTVEEHVATCEQCQAELQELNDVRGALDMLPPEAWLDGPPEDADLVLQRTLRSARAERSGRRLSHRLFGAVAAAVLGLVAVGAGVLVGRGTAPQAPVAGPTFVTTAPTPPAGTKVASFTDPKTGVRLTVRLEPAAGWVRVNAAAIGLPVGQRCRLVVMGRNGEREVAGSWLVSQKAAKEGTSLDGAALVAPENVTAVKVENFDGQQFVSVSI